MYSYNFPKFVKDFLICFFSIDYNNPVKDFLSTSNINAVRPFGIHSKSGFKQVFIRFDNECYESNAKKSFDYLVCSGIIFYNKPIGIMLPNWQPIQLPSNKLSKFSNSQPVAIKIFDSPTTAQKALADDRPFDPTIDIEYLLLDRYILYPITKGYSLESLCQFEKLRGNDSVIIYIIFQIAARIIYIHMLELVHNNVDLNSIYISCEGEVSISGELSSTTGPQYRASELNGFKSILSFFTERFPSLSKTTEIFEITEQNLQISIEGIYNTLKKIKSLSEQEFNNAFKNMVSENVIVYFVVDKRIYCSERTSVFLARVTIDSDEFNHSDAVKFALSFVTGQNPFKGVTKVILKVSASTLLHKEAEILNFLTFPNSLRCYYYIQDSSSNSKLQNIFQEKQILFLEYIDTLDFKNLSNDHTASWRMYYFHDPQLCSVLLKVFIQIATDLKQIHDKGLVHGDVSLENVLVLRDLIPKIGDFEASFVEADEKAVYTGTACYNAPPESRSAQKLFLHTTRKADIFGFGVMIEKVFFELYGLFRPSENNVENPTIKAISELKISCLNNDPLQRPSCEEIIIELTSLLNYEEIMIKLISTH